MKQTFQDFKEALKRPKVIAVGVVVVTASLFAINTFGYLIWRRFPVPIEITATALIWIAIAKIINEKSLSHIVGLLAWGLFFFAVLALSAAFIDSYFFPIEGYFGFGVHTAMWLWIIFQSYRAWYRLGTLPPRNKKKITESATVIIAEMSAVRQENAQVLKETAPVIREAGLRFVADA